MLDSVGSVRQNRRPVWSPRCVVCGLFATTLVAVSVAAPGCGDLFPGLWASLGGDTAGERGEIRVMFINNTPFRAVFTAGTYDPLDESAAPAYSQFGFEEDRLTLPGDSESSIGEFPCARIFSIGGSRMFALIEANEPDIELIAEASQAGVTFFDEGATDAVGDPVRMGMTSAFEARLGSDFPCGALLIIRFEINDVGDEPFRINFEMVPSESPR